MFSSGDLDTEAKKRVGQTLRGKWHIDRLLDVGGMGAVYAATHRNGNQVAIKVLHQMYARSAEVRARFMREGYAANRVRHPGAVGVQDDDETEDGSAFLVMELLDGQSLETRIRDFGKLSQPEVLVIADQVLDVLVAANKNGVIHRDIKPPNIYLTTAGEVRLLDFGLARVRERTGGNLTRTGMVIGTASYMPPEQARGKRDAVDARSDLWAVGATMFRALSGRYVHEGGTPGERLIAAMSQHAPPLSSVAPHVSPVVAAVVDRSLQFQKHDRFASALEMQAAVRAAFQRTENEPIPSARRGIRQLRPPAAPAGAAPDDLDIHVSVVFAPEGPDDDIVVEVEQSTGPTTRYALMRKPTPAPFPAAEVDDELSEVTVVPLEAPAGKTKPE